MQTLLVWFVLSSLIAPQVCPGYVATDMTSYKGPKTPDEGADTLIWLALQPQGTIMGSGEFFADRKVISLL